MLEEIAGFVVGRGKLQAQHVPPQRRSAADEQPPEGVESPFHAYSILRLPKVMPPIFPVETHPSLAPGDYNGAGSKTAPKNELQNAQARLMSGESLTSVRVTSHPPSFGKARRPEKGLSICWASEDARGLQESKQRLQEFENGQHIAHTARMTEAKRFAKNTSAAER